MIDEKDEKELVRQFSYHPPRSDQLPRYTELRSAALSFARVILRCSPPCADRTTALRKVREAVMTANAAIAIEESRQ